MKTGDDFAQGRRRARRRVVAILLPFGLLLLICAGAAIHASLRVGPASAGPTPAAPGGLATAPVPAPVLSGGAPPSGTLRMPADLAFLTIAGMPVPVSPSAGPANMDSGRGFARTPIGAVLAAAQIVTRTTATAGPKIYEPVLRDRVTGPDVGKLRFDITSTYDQARTAHPVPYGDPAGTINATYKGWRVEAASDTEVVVRLLTQTADRNGNQVLVTGVIQMVWRDGDWSMMAPPNGDWRTSMSVISASAAGSYQQFMAGG